jgi:hypothetical protein
MSDLLAISPSVLLSRSLSTESARSLRRKALRFRDVQNRLDMTGPSRPTSMENVPLYGEVDDIYRVIPGTSLLIRAVKSICAVQIVRSTTGCAIDSWLVPGPEPMFGITGLTVHDSETYGVVVLFHIVQRRARPGDRRSVQALSSGYQLTRISAPQASMCSYCTSRVLQTRAWKRCSLLKYRRRSCINR